MIALLLAALAAPAGAGEPAPKEISQDITIRARDSAPGVQVPPPTASKPVVDEVLRSLSLGRGAPPPGPERVLVEADAARFGRPYPEPPFLSLSPANIEALYDEWSFEVLDDRGEAVWRADGVGRLKERLEWDGIGTDGGLTIVAGRSYSYRFTGRRAGRAFVVDGGPAPLKSFTHREYAGETRLEAAAGLFFKDGKDSAAKGSETWIDALAGRLRRGEARRDGTYRLELASKDPRGALAKARAKALRKRLAKSLVVAPERVVVALVLAARGETVAGFLPPSKGAALRIE